MVRDSYFFLWVICHIVPQKHARCLFLFVSGEKCVWVDDKWLSPGEFEKFAGKAHNKNWKLSVRCGSTALQKLIQVWEELRDLRPKSTD